MYKTKSELPAFRQSGIRLSDFLKDRIAGLKF